MTLIYNITHIRNLPNIIKHGGLWCEQEVASQNLTHINIAYQHIKDRRAQKQVPGKTGGMLIDYVPFYFAPRSPMLYAIRNGLVANYSDGQEPILHLVSSAEAVRDSGLEFAFTDGHAVMNLSHFFTELGDLAKIDWAIMSSKYWNDTNTDGDRKRRRQAEFLVYKFFPLALIEAVGTYNQAVASQVSALLSSTEHKPQVAIQHLWYYD